MLAKIICLMVSGGFSIGLVQAMLEKSAIEKELEISNF